MKAFVLRDEIGRQIFEFLGMVLDGTSRRMRHSPSMLANVVSTHKDVAHAARHWQCSSCVRETPLSPPRALPAHAVGTGGDLPVVTTSSGTDGPADSQLSYRTTTGAGSNFWRDLGETVFCSEASS